MSLSLTDCASQFDVYASSHETEAAKHRLRYIDHEGDDTVGGRAIRHYEAIQQAKWESAAFQLRFAATFLRDQVPRWTKETPTKEGTYWRRDSHGVVTIEDVGYIGNGTRKGSRLAMCYGSDMGYVYLQDAERGGMWCGPLIPPGDPS